MRIWQRNRFINYRVEPQDVDFTLRATLASLSSSILNTAGLDAYGKGFGVDVLQCRQPFVGAVADGRRDRPSSRTVHGLYGGDVDQRLRPGPVDPKLHADRRCGPRVRTGRDAVGDDRPDDSRGRGPLVGRARTRGGGGFPCRRRQPCRARSARWRPRSAPNTGSFTATSTSTAMSIRCAILR